MLVLLPEIALTENFLRRFEAALRRAAGAVALLAQVDRAAARLAGDRRGRRRKSWSARARRCSCLTPSSA